MNGTKHDNGDSNEICSDIVLYPELEDKFDKYCKDNTYCYIKLREYSDTLNETG